VTAAAGSELPAEEREAVASLTALHLGQHPRLISRIFSANGAVYRVELPGANVIVKTAAAGDDIGISLEAWVYRRLREAGVPVPRVLALDASRRCIARACLIIDELSGRPLRSLRAAPAEYRDLCRELGSHMRRLHSVVLESYGWLDRLTFVRDGRVRGQHHTWPEAVRASLGRAIELLRREHLISDDFVQSVDLALATHEHLLALSPASLLHGDFDDTHVFVEAHRRRIVGIIDFGDAMSGDPAWDFARFSLLSESLDLDDLLAGYSPDPQLAPTIPARVLFYRLVLALNAARWAHTQASPAWSARYLEHARFTVGALS
jgi:aminoglycoside phosphotransferase (APT) family kinase protein